MSEPKNNGLIETITRLLADPVFSQILKASAVPPSPDPFQNAIPRGSPLGVNAMEVARRDPVWDAASALYEQGMPRREIEQSYPNYPGGGPWGFDPNNPNGMQDVMRVLIEIFGKDKAFQ